jgi:hypothetical protein
MQHHAGFEPGKVSRRYRRTSIVTLVIAVERRNSLIVYSVQRSMKDVIG